MTIDEAIEKGSLFRRYARDLSMTFYTIYLTEKAREQLWAKRETRVKRLNKRDKSILCMLMAAATPREDVWVGNHYVHASPIVVFMEVHK